jgi:hypothetical protein
MLRDFLAKSRWVCRAIAAATVLLANDPGVALGAGERPPAGLPENGRLAPAGSRALGSAASAGVFDVLTALLQSSDNDDDGVPDWSDSCPSDANSDQRDGDGDGVGDICDNCPADFNPGQSDGAGRGVGDLCAGTAPASFVLKQARLRANGAPAHKLPNGSLYVRGVLDSAEYADVFGELRRAGVIVGVLGGGLETPGTMVFPFPRCLQFTKNHVRCIGTRGEVGDFRRQRKQTHLYNVVIHGKGRSFSPPLSKLPVDVVLSLAGLDRRSGLVNCRLYGKKVIGCRAR